MIARNVQTLTSGRYMDMYQSSLLLSFLTGIRLQVSSDNAYFATASDDGSVKLWDLQKLDGKSLINKSRQTYSRQGTCAIR